MPTTSVRASYLQGEREVAIEEGLPTARIEDAAADFAGFVDRRRRVRELWAVPVTELWFIDGLLRYTGPTTAAPLSSATASHRP